MSGFEETYDNCYFLLFHIEKKCITTNGVHMVSYKTAKTRCSSGAYDEPDGCLFVSQEIGQDFPLCGSAVNPCKTLSVALLKVHDGGKVCVDGRNSETRPYGCFLINSRKVMKSTDLLDKSVTIQSWLSMAHISCKFLFGLAFKSPYNRILSVTLANLAFHHNGVMLYKVGCSHVVISNCRFINCQAAIGIRQQESRLCLKSSLIITNSEFLYNDMSVFVWVYNEFFNVKISRCVFKGKVGRFKITMEERKIRGSVYIRSTTQRHKVHIQALITDSIFQELAHKYYGYALAFKIEEIFSTGYVSLFNTTFLNNENSVFAYGGLDVQLSRVTINSTYGHAITASGPPKLWPNVIGLKLNLNQCILGNNRNGVVMATNPCLGGPGFNCSTSEQSVVVNNSFFAGGNETMVSGAGDAISFRVKTDYSTRRPNFIKSLVLLENVTFQGLPYGALHAVIQKNVQGLIIVKNCKFLNNSQFVYRLTERATVQIEFYDEDPPESCLTYPNHSSKFISNNSTQIPVIFEDSIFEGNVGIAAALTFLNGNVTIKNCRFKDNQGLTIGGHMYMKTGYGSLNVINTTFLQTHLNVLANGKQRRISSNGCFLHSESAGYVVITNSSFIANVNQKFNPVLAATKTRSIKVDATSTIRCPSGRRVKIDKIEKTEGFEFTKGSNTCWMKVNYIKLFCEYCPGEFYSLKRGMTTGLDVNKNTVCLKCPYGASCENGNIKAKDNFWGLSMATDPPSVKFFHCPPEYCISPIHSGNYAYNACHGNRSGVLCGKCSDGFSEALYSTSCRKNDHCKEHLFWLATVIYIVVFAVYFVFKPPVFSVLHKQCLWFKATAEENNAQTLPPENDKEHDPGYLKIVFYFYQVAELVMVNSPEKALHMVPFIPTVISIFNFQVKTLDGSIGCPFPGLSAVTKELFLCLKFLATLLSIGFIYVIHRLISKSRYISRPRIAVYQAVALETLLLGYETLADTTLKLMHCVPMGSDWHLFIDGNIQCWQWWQYLLIAFIVVFIIPLIVVLYWGSLMLANAKVSAKEFLIACALPLPCLLVWIVQCCRRTEEEDVVFRGSTDRAEEIRKVLHEPFRQPTIEDQGTLYWESVLTGRRLILLTIHTFAIRPLIKFVCLDCVCVLILVHHLSVRPFRDCKANILESLSLVGLVVICTFSLAETSYFSEGTDPTGPSKSQFHVFQWIEIVALGLVPALVFVLVAFAALSQVLRLLYYCVKLFCFLRNKLYCRERSSMRLSLSRELLLHADSDELQTVP